MGFGDRGGGLLMLWVLLMLWDAIDTTGSMDAMGEEFGLYTF